MKAVVLHSGGMDSTVCLLLAMEDGKEVLSLGIDYGQRHRIELDFAAAQCRQYGVQRRVLRVEWSKPDRSIPVDRSVDEMRQAVSPAFLPARNVVFLSLAYAEAAGQQADEVWLGVNALDYSGYPDCRPEFVEAYRQMTSIAIPDGPSLVTPLLTMDKPAIAAEAKRLGVGPDGSWSCYQPVFTGGSVTACGKCDACRLHVHAWEKLSP